MQPRDSADFRKEKNLEWYSNLLRDVPDDQFVEATGSVGDVYLLHPLMTHSASDNALRRIRIITNPPVSLKEPHCFDREDGNYSLVERKTMRSIGEEKLKGWKITAPTVRKRIENSYTKNIRAVIQALKESPGMAHIAFDGWRSRNRLGLYGITAFFRDHENRPCKIVLVLPDVADRHTGTNIAAEVLDVIHSYGIGHKIGYFTLDNASNNDTAMMVIGGELGFNGNTRRGRCIGHRFNLVAKALLFGDDFEAFEAEIDGEEALTDADVELWRRKGPVSKLHSWVLQIRRSDRLTNLLRQVQQANSVARVLDVVLDNDTR
ncbi:hypothetical protein NUW58_g5187 [Xylaria curta]|uniref:Uncharacterized protein n=1 Tax=Xylaria curta TaxID=42375 RepID=A0ACC1P3Z6_9PEZI|nr:hypothetical protein NUW58_g5187 [Xylaria curta]